MANFYGYGQNQSFINQLLRQKDNIENMINQYSQPQAPVQNIINTGVTTEFEAKILGDDEQIENVLVNKRTMFLDKKNKKLCVKEVDGKISETYEIIVPLDEKDKKILALEQKLKEMEELINVKLPKFNEPTNVEYKSVTNGDGNIKSATETSGKTVSKSAK